MQENVHHLNTKSIMKFQYRNFEVEFIRFQITPRDSDFHLMKWLGVRNHHLHTYYKQINHMYCSGSEDKTIMTTKL